MRGRSLDSVTPLVLLFLSVLSVTLVPCGAACAEGIGELTDPEHPLVTAALDVLSASVEQEPGGQLTFSIETRGPIPTSLPAPEDTMTYLWFVDTDEDPGTGQPHGPVGSEFNLRAVIGENDGGGFVDAVGGEPGGGAGTVTVEGNFVRLRVGLTQISNPGDFHWNCSTFQVEGGVFLAGNPETDPATSVTLPYTPPARVRVTTPLLALSLSGPTTTGRLEVEIRDASGNLLPNEEHLLAFHSTNEAVATVGAAGLVTAQAVPEFHPQVPYIEAWADGVMADNSAVVRVTATDLGVAYQMLSAEHVAFYLAPAIEGVDLAALTAYYQVVAAVNLAYATQAAGLGAVPTGGGLQYFVLDVADDPDTAICGASGNPIRLGWEWGKPVHNSCYIINDPANRVPQWFVMFHELGHNFTCACNAFNLFCMGPSPAHNTAYNEGMASLAAMWSWKAVVAWPQGLRAMVWQDIDAHLGGYAAGFRQSLEDYRNAGAVYDALDPNVVDGILLELLDQYGPRVWWDLFSTFLPSNDPLPLALESREKQAAWFVAAVSASAGEDLRGLFASRYGFPTDEAAWLDILSAVEARIAARPFAGIKTRPNLVPALSALLLGP